MANGSDSASKGFGDQFVGKLQGQLDTKAPVYGKSLFTGAGNTTKGAWDKATNFGNEVAYGGGFYGPQKEAATGFGGLADTYGGLAGAYDPNSEAFKTMRQGALDDAITNVGAGFTQSGRFGGGSYIDKATQSAVEAIAPLDYANMQNDINNRYRSADSQAGIYSGQFGMGQQALTNKNAAIAGLGQIGAARDANTQGIRLGQADLFDRTNNADLDRLIKIGAAFGDPVGASNQPNWLQQGLGAALGFGGQAISGGLFR